jgi:hypothetical protein
MEPKKDKLHYHPIHDRSGKARFYLDQDKIHIYSWAGEPVAFVDKGAIFTHKARFLGWYDEGWVRDPDGKCVGFTEPGKGGPNPPAARHADPPPDHQPAPAKPEVQEPAGRPVRKPIWSNLSDAEFFTAAKSEAKKTETKKAPAKKAAAKKK